MQAQTGLGFAEAIDRFIAAPLALSSVSVAHGQFADDLPWYPAEWVWHGLIVSTAADVVRFMRSPLLEPLLEQLVSVPVEHPLWTNPCNGYGVMVEPGVRYGHTGGGPNYSAACFHFVETGLTGCVLTQSQDEDAAMNELVNEIAAI